MVTAVDAGGTFPLLIVAVIAGELFFFGVEASEAVSEGTSTPALISYCPFHIYFLSH